MSLKNYSSVRFALAAKVLLIIALMIVAGILWKSGSRDVPAARQDPLRSSKSERLGKVESSFGKPSKSGMAFEVGALSLQEVYFQLPEKSEESALKLMSSSQVGEQLIREGASFRGGRTLEIDPETEERNRLLFRRLGELEGEEAINYLLEKYGEEEPTTALGITFAILGWMDVDLEAALAAFQELSRSETPNLPSMRWKGRKVLTGFGGKDRPAAVQFGIREVMRAVSLVDHERGLALLGEFPWSHYASFHSGLTGYAEANVADPAKDLDQMREAFAAIVEERFLSRVDGIEPSKDFRASHMERIDRMLAQTWADRDLDAAIKWYSRELEWDRTLATEVERILTVFGGIRSARRSEIIKWIEKNRTESDWDDRLIISYTLGWASGPVDKFVERLVILPIEERDRTEIVERWTMNDNRNGVSLPRVSREDAHRLFEAADLSVAERTRLQEEFDTAVQNGERLQEARRLGF